MTLFRVEIGSQGAAAGFQRWEDTSEGRSTRILVIWDEGWLQLIQKLSIAPRCTIVWYGFIFCFWFSLNICFFLAQRVVAWGNWSRTTYVAIPPPYTFGPRGSKIFNNRDHYKTKTDLKGKSTFAILCSTKLHALSKFQIYSELCFQ